MKTNPNNPSLLDFAEQLALQHFPTGKVDPEHIAHESGLTVLHTGFRDDIDGILLHEHGRDVIVVNTRRAARGSDRARFTIAHELGHFFARQGTEPPPAVAARLPGRSRKEERPADRFAARLLLPAKSFLEEFGNSTLTGLMRVSVLSKVFGTSLTATAYRALELDCFASPSAVLLWTQTGMRCGRRISRGTWHMGRGLVTMANEPPAEGPTADALNSQRSGLRTGTSALSSWFPDLGSALEPVELAEEVLARGSHGWITLLQPAQAAA